MKFCQHHWDMLREAIKARGLFGLVSANGRDLVARMKAELEGKDEPSDFDPLMTAHNMIWADMTQRIGLALMMPKEDGTQRCPVCEAMVGFEQVGGHAPAETERVYIEGPADAVLAQARSLGLLEA